MNWGICILLFFEIIIFMVSFYLNRQDIMAPSVIMNLVFIFSTSLVLINSSKWNIMFEFKTICILLSGIITFTAIDGCMASVVKGKIQQDSISIKPVYFEKWKMIFICLFDFIIVMLVLKEVKRIAATNTYFKNIFYAYRMITSHSDSNSPIESMNGIINQSMKFVIISGFLSSAFFVNNVLICKEKLYKNIIYVIPVLALCTMTFFTGVRTNILRLCTFSLVVWYILAQYKTGWKTKTSWKFVKVLIISLIVILVFFGVSQKLLGRVGGSTDIVSVISNYAGAPIVHFNQYIQDPPPKNDIWGQETFTGVWKVLYKLGVIDNYYSVHEEFRPIVDKDFGNVYTFFRRFIQDFGWIGMIIMTALTSLLFTIIYNRKIKNKELTYKQWAIIIEYGYMFYIVAMTSIDNLVHDYINVGTLLLLLLLHFMMWFLFKCKIRIGSFKKELV